MDVSLMSRLGFGHYFRQSPDPAVVPTSIDLEASLELSPNPPLKVALDLSVVLLH